MKTHHVLAGLALLFIGGRVHAGHDNRPLSHRPVQPPVIPVGLDAYRQWSEWPLQRIGVRAYMRSTDDRSGGNEAADASHFLFMGADRDANVTLDVAGKGVLYFFRANHWHGSPWHIIVDGRDQVVAETGTADPAHAHTTVEHAVFYPSHVFPKPLAYTWTTTHGADLSWVPIGFTHSLRLAYGHTHYGTGYYIYKKYANYDDLSRPITPWSSHDAPAADILKLLRTSGSDIAPRGITRKTGTVLLDRAKREIADIKAGPSVIRALHFTVPLDKAIALEHAHLKITWDGAARASVDTPLSLFFGAGTLYNRDRRAYLVKAFPMVIHYDYAHHKVKLSCYYPMPFFRSARIELTGLPPGQTKLTYEIRYAPYYRAPAQSSYFHATYRNMPHPRAGHDLVLLDTRGLEGHAAWSGSFVGTSIVFSHDAFLKTLEGDPRFFFDDSQSPQAYGTGTEEWGGGGDYWSGHNLTLPFAGHPTGAPDPAHARNSEDRIESAYRFLLGDLMPFGRRARIDLEHGGWNLSQEHYESVTYWYGLPSPSLVLSDRLDVGNARSEARHDYVSLRASAVVPVTSRYDLGIDTLPSKAPWGLKASQKAGYRQLAGRRIHPATTKTGRHTRGTSAFTMRVDPANHGVLLRRTLDYSFPDQRARVQVAAVGAAGNASTPHWHDAGIWYLAGSTTDVYSNPKNERGRRQHIMQTSDRRFRDDEFLIPARFTRGHDALRIRVHFVPVNRPLFPGQPFPKKGAWSAFGYTAYSYVMPAWPAHL